MSGRDLVDAVVRVARRNQAPRPLPGLERAFRPSMPRFAAFRRAGVPFRLDGLGDARTSRTTWSLGRLQERFGERLISVIATKDGRLRYDERTGVSFETVRLGDYIERLARGDRPDEYVVAPGDTWLPELTADLEPPDVYRHAAWRNSRFWLSGPDTASPLHRDVAENVFLQLLGRKRFYLYSPAATPWLYSYPLRSALPNFSRFDPEQPDYDRFPLSREVRPLEVILEPGDALYLPSRWWHQVRSLDVSVSFNYWFADGVLAMVVRAAEFVKRVRALEIYGLETRLRASGQLGTR